MRPPASRLITDSPQVTFLVRSTTYFTCNRFRRTPPRNPAHKGATYVH